MDGKSPSQADVSGLHMRHPSPPAVETILYLSLVLYRINEQFAKCTTSSTADGHVNNALFSFCRCMTQFHSHIGAAVNYSEYGV